ncbi:MAG TPA: glycosyl hydrolase family 18 protein [Methylomirabilota bacterium]|nr:glycosyl hydrolase family 18 protein [Methylomirabilota bacterium]
MKKFLVLITLLFLILLFVFVIARQKIKQDLASVVPYPTTTQSPPSPTDASTTAKETTSLFVPYWTIKGQSIEDASYDQYIYFGIAPTIDGIDPKEQGTRSLDQFLSVVPADKTKLLAVRLIDSNTNFAILKDQNAQKKVMNDTITLAKEKGFEGIVQDLEVSAIPFDSVVKQITSFTTAFAQETKKNKMSFSVLVYGDVFYRLRPFDVKILAKQSDQIMVMAYDFSKVKGDPGPNFPLRGQQTYGYDMTKMADDFVQSVPPQKITVVFGLFGYDWQVDNQGKTIQQGKAKTTQEIQKAFIDSCQAKRCAFSRDKDASEIKISYTDHADAKHSIWFEDMNSVAAKKAYLKKRGITSFSYWAYSYF